MGTLAAATRGFGSRILTFGHMIRFSHSIFALPFALAGVLFAVHRAGAWPPGSVWLWVVVAMVGARSAAMAFNRIVDADIDAANPRTRNREIPRGVLTRSTAWIFTVASAAVFVLACARLNPLALTLSPVALALVGFYSFTKRFTWTSHFFLGLSLAVAPVGGWVAVAGRLDPAPFLLAAGVLCWVAGFDVFYALQDVDFDRRRGLHSFPARFGARGTVVAARLLHLAAVGFFASLAWALDLSFWYPVGIAGVAGVLFYEHRLVRAGDLSRLNKAFFDMNALVSVAYLVVAAAGTLL